MIAIIKYNAGNVLSVQYALKRLGFEAVVTADHSTIKSAADWFVLQGQLNKITMRNLKQSQRKITLEPVKIWWTSLIIMCKTQQVSVSVIS